MISITPLENWIEKGMKLILEKREAKQRVVKSLPCSEVANAIKKYNEKAKRKAADINLVKETYKKNAQNKKPQSKLYEFPKKYPLKNLAELLVIIPQGEFLCIDQDRTPDSSYKTVINMGFYNRHQIIKDNKVVIFLDDPMLIAENREKKGLGDGKLKRPELKGLVVQSSDNLITGKKAINYLHLKGIGKEEIEKVEEHYPGQTPLILLTEKRPKVLP